MECYNCVLPAVCHIKGNEKSAMCEDCAMCRCTVDDNQGKKRGDQYDGKCNRCLEPVYAKVEWDVVCEDIKIRLQKPVCKQHMETTPDEDDCSCAKTARNKTFTLYKWL